MKLVTEYPFWFIIFCLAAGLAYSFLLYFKDKKNEFSDQLQMTLLILRFLVTGFIAFLLLSPLLKTIIRQVEKPIIILAQDNSHSLLLNNDSVFYSRDYPEQLQVLKDELSRKYDTRLYTFGDAIQEDGNLDFSDKQTDISLLLQEMQTRYSNRNVGALVLLTDGIYNKGQSPLYQAEGVKFPVYTVALGDTTTQRDLVIARVNHNKVSFLGNNFPVEIVVKANRLRGETAELEVLHEGAEVFRKKIDITSERFTETIPLQLLAKEAGIQHYQVRVSEMPAEISPENNTRDFFIEVLETKLKVLILSPAPHPDVAAIRSALESSLNYEVTVSTVAELNDPPEKFHAIIFDQLPAISASSSLIINKVISTGIPSLFILGGASDLNLFNTFKTGVNIQAEKTGFTESQPSLNEDFALFTLTEETRRNIPDFPPLSCPFGSIRTQNSTTSLFFQRIGDVVTELPLILFNEDPSRKTGVVLGEGLWRWKLADYARNGSHDAFNEVITKLVQYLCAKADKSFFRLKAKQFFLENDPVIFTAEVYNQTYEMINDPDIEMAITNEEGKLFPYSFSKSGRAYQLNAGLFPVGKYRYSAKVKVGNKVYQASGEFSVVAQNVESLNTLADHRLLFNLSSRHGGTMYYPASMKDLAEDLKAREDIKSISYTEKRFNDLVNLPWAFLLIVLLLGAEWFLRKRAGSY